MRVVCRREIKPCIIRTMDKPPSRPPPRLIDYMVVCGLPQAKLVDYISGLEESKLATGLSKAALQECGLVPQILSMYPLTQSKEFPLPNHFLDVSNLY